MDSPKNTEFVQIFIISFKIKCTHGIHHLLFQALHGEFLLLYQLLTSDLHLLSAPSINLKTLNDLPFAILACNWERVHHTSR